MENKFLDYNGVSYLWAKVISNDQAIQDDFEAYKSEVNSKIEGVDLTKYLPLAGGTMTGHLIGNDGATFLSPLYMKSYLYLKNDSSPIMFFMNSSNTISGSIMDYLGGSSSTTSRYIFRQYSRSSSDYSRLTTYENYCLPNTTADLGTSTDYNILTTKSLVSITQGGTGAATQSGAFNNIVAPGGSITGNFAIKNASSPKLYFRHSEAASSAYPNGSIGIISSSGRMFMRQYSIAEDGNGTAPLSIYEDYYLPAVAKDLSENASYSIITTKNLSAADGRWLSLRGGTLTGSLTINNADGSISGRYFRLTGKSTSDNLTRDARLIFTSTLGVGLYLRCSTDEDVTSYSIQNSLILLPDSTQLRKPLEIGSGGTGATSKSGARTNLGFTVGTSFPTSPSTDDIHFLFS